VRRSNDTSCSERMTAASWIARAVRILHLRPLLGQSPDRAPAWKSRLYAHKAQSDAATDAAPKRAVSASARNDCSGLDLKKNARRHPIPVSPKESMLLLQHALAGSVWPVRAETTTTTGKTNKTNKTSLARSARNLRRPRTASWNLTAGQTAARCCRERLARSHASAIGTREEGSDSAGRSARRPQSFICWSAAEATASSRVMSTSSSAVSLDRRHCRRSRNETLLY
jgi:hypothetical protein